MNGHDKTQRLHHPATLRQIASETLLEWREDRVAVLGAALAFYSFFSIGPILLIAVVIAGWFAAGIGVDDAGQKQLHNQLQNYFGPETSHTIEQLMRAAGRSRNSTLATIGGIVGILFSATGSLVSLKSTMNTIWGVAEPPGANWRWMARNRFASLVVVLGVGLLLMVSSLATAGLWSMVHLAKRNIPISLPIAHSINVLISLLVVSVLFGAVFKLLPDVRVGWRPVLPGAVLTAVLFLIGKQLFALYVSYVSIESAYGTAGSLAILLLFFYYSAQIFFLGAEFTQVYAQETGADIQPKRGAIRISEVLVERQAALRKMRRNSGPRH